MKDLEFKKLKTHLATRFVGETFTEEQANDIMRCILPKLVMVKDKNGKLKLWRIAFSLDNKLNSMVLLKGSDSLGIKVFEEGLLLSRKKQKVKIHNFEIEMLECEIERLKEFLKTKKTLGDIDGK